MLDIINPCQCGPCELKTASKHFFCEYYRAGVSRFPAESQKVLVFERYPSDIVVANQVLHLFQDAFNLDIGTED